MLRPLVGRSWKGLLGHREASQLQPSCLLMPSRSSFIRYHVAAPLCSNSQMTPRETTSRRRHVDTERALACGLPLLRAPEKGGGGVRGSQAHPHAAMNGGIERAPSTSDCSPCDVILFVAQQTCHTRKMRSPWKCPMSLTTASEL